MLVGLPWVRMLLLCEIGGSRGVNLLHSIASILVQFTRSFLGIQAEDCMLSV